MLQCWLLLVNFRHATPLSFNVLFLENPIEYPHNLYIARNYRVPAEDLHYRQCVSIFVASLAVVLNFVKRFWTKAQFSRRPNAKWMPKRRKCTNFLFVRVSSVESWMQSCQIFLKSRCQTLAKSSPKVAQFPFLVCSPIVYSSKQTTWRLTFWELGCWEWRSSSSGTSGSSYFILTWRNAT